MNSVILLSNIKKYPEHCQYTSTIKNTMPLIHNDINQISASELMKNLTSSAPDVIISLDFSGFELKTLTGECLLNTLPCKILNIISVDATGYHTFLSKKLSLSMLFYDISGNDVPLPAKYPNMRYYYPLKEISSATASREIPSADMFRDIWNHFKKEALLP